MRLLIFVYNCRTVLSIVERICGLEDVEQSCWLDKLFCDIVEEITRFVEFIPMIVILGEECRKQMFNCSKAIDKRCSSISLFELKLLSELENF